MSLRGWYPPEGQQAGRERKGPWQNISMWRAGMRPGWFNSWHVVQTECVVDMHGSMETEQRAIWFDLRLIICQSRDGTLSIRAFLSNCLSYLHRNKALKTPAVLISDPRSDFAQRDVFNFGLLINAVSSAWFCCFYRTLRLSGVPVELCKNLTDISAPSPHLCLLFYFLWH